MASDCQTARDIIAGAAAERRLFPSHHDALLRLRAGSIPDSTPDVAATGRTLDERVRAFTTTHWTNDPGAAWTAALNGDSPAEVAAARARLAFAGSVVDVLREVFAKAVSHVRPSLSDAVERCYWNEHDGWLSPPDLLAALERAQACNEHVVHHLEALRQALWVAERPQAARRAHLHSRLGLLEAGAAGRMSVRGVALGELAADFLLVQWGDANDVRHASARRSPADTTAAMLTRMQYGGRLLGDRMFVHATGPVDIAALLTGPANEVTWARLIDFATRREHASGVDPVDEWLEDRPTA